MKKLIVGNQKSYLKSNEVNDFIAGLSMVKDLSHVLICPSSIYMERYIKHNFITGCQDVSKYPSGADTGELSIEQIKSIGASFSLVGHSEQRSRKNETIEDTNIKIRQLLEEELVPILCVGESKAERDANKTEEVVLNELQGALDDLSTKDVEKIIIAYEPIWSIGTGIIPTNDEIENIISFIREYIEDNYHIPGIILYGGSVNPHNIDTLNIINGVDGYLIGGASSKIDEFIEIINKCTKEE